jgi:hypothetical protein
MLVALLQITDYRFKDIDYRCDDGRFRSVRHECQVPSPASQNLEHRIWIYEITLSRITNVSNNPRLSSCVRNRLTHQLLGRLKSTISNLWIYLQKRQILRSWDLGLTIHAG